MVPAGAVLVRGADTTSARVRLAGGRVVGHHEHVVSKRGSAGVTVEAMDHYTVLTDDMAGSVAFYRKALGLKSGPSPDVDVPVTWMYVGDQAVLHLVGRKPKSRSRATGRFDHVAFRCRGYATTKARLKRHGVEFVEQNLPAIGLQQIFLEGPEGVWIELIFQPQDVGCRLSEGWDPSVLRTIPPVGARRVAIGVSFSALCCVQLRKPERVCVRA